MAKPQDDATIRAVRGERTMNLDGKERALIEHLREHGAVPAEYALGARKSMGKAAEKLKGIQAEHEGAIKELEAYERRFEVLTGLEGLERQSIHRIPPISGKRSVCVPILVGTDWHYEERVDPKQVNGRNEFAPEIARARIRQFFRRGLWLIEHLKGGLQIDDAVLALLGDLVTGYIHDELMESNYMSPTEAIVDVHGLLCEGIEFLLREGKFRKLNLVCCHGNHGRTTDKPRVSTSYKNSYEWLMYTMLARQYAKERRVEFQIATGYHARMEILGWPIRFHHGDAVRYRDGIGGPTIPINKKIHMWDRESPAHMDIFGHLHQRVMDAKFAMSGALIGYSPWAVKSGLPYAPPQQLLVIVEQSFGVGAVAPIYLGDGIEEKA